MKITYPYPYDTEIFDLIGPHQAIHQPLWSTIRVNPHASRFSFSFLTAPDSGCFANWNLQGALPPKNVFIVGRFSLRVLLPWRATDLVQWLPVSRFNFYVANKTYLELPLDSVLFDGLEQNWQGFELEKPLMLEPQVSFSGVLQGDGVSESKHELYLTLLLDGLLHRPIQ